MLSQLHPIQAPQQNRIRFRIRTQSRWINGDVTTLHRRLVDALNSENAETFIAEDVSLETCLDAGHGGEAVCYASIDTSSILFAMPIEDATGYFQDPLVSVKKRAERVVIGVGPYEISGNIHLFEGCKLRDLLSAMRNRFVVLTEAAIRRTDDLGFEEEHEVVFVNRKRVDFVGGARLA